MSEKPRVRSLSTRWLIPFKIAVFILYTAFFGALMLFYLPGEGWAGLVGTIGIYGYLFYRLLKMSAKIEHVEFDDDFLYVIRRKSDVLIPLENIRSVEIKTMGGVYRVDLYFEDILGTHFYFKPSLFYPLNFKSKDDLVDLLRHKIDLARKRKVASSPNVLTS